MFDIGNRYAHYNALNTSNFLGHEKACFKRKQTSQDDSSDRGHRRPYGLKVTDMLI